MRILFFFVIQLMRHPLIELFHLFSLLQILNDHRMVDIKFLGRFLCSCKGISFDDALNWLLSTSNHPSLLRSSSSRLLSPLQKLLKHQCTVCSLAVPGPKALLMF